MSAAKAKGAKSKEVAASAASAVGTPEIATVVPINVASAEPETGETAGETADANRDGYCTNDVSAQ